MASSYQQHADEWPAAELPSASSHAEAGAPPERVPVWRGVSASRYLAYAAALCAALLLLAVVAYRAPAEESGMSDAYPCNTSHRSTFFVRISLRFRRSARCADCPRRSLVCACMH